MGKKDCCEGAGYPFGLIIIMIIFDFIFVIMILIIEVGGFNSVFALTLTLQFNSCRQLLHAISIVLQKSGWMNTRISTMLSQETASMVQVMYHGA